MAASYQRHRLCRIASICLCITLSPLAAWAEEAEKMKPASQSQMNIYTSMGSVNICALNQEGVSLDKSIRASTEMILSTMSALHGDSIKGLNNDKPLDRQRIANGSIIEMSLRVKSMCGEAIKGDNKIKLDEILSQIRKAEQENSKAGQK
jgi:hypothetical protein